MAVPRTRASMVLSDEPAWSTTRLKRFAARLLAGRQLVVVSQRQPIVFDRCDEGVAQRVPAGGLVTALLPLARACGATWVAASTGDADGQAVDGRGHVTVADAEGAWGMKLMSLPDGLHRAHCDGFSNGGLWPACHGAVVPTRFAAADWRAYQDVNARFADAVCEALQQPDAVVHVHDYHLCLVPKLLRERVPRVTIVHFWHIPWPEPDALQGCPWLGELARGLAAADAVVFQTREDADRFSATCSRLALRPRAAIRSVPISIAWPTPGATLAAARPTPPSGDVRCVLGVDRFDYAKGLLERLDGFERLLERQPQWRGRVTLVQVAAPTREAVPAYQAYRERVLARVDEVNRRFGVPGWLPVDWRTRTHSAAEVDALYRAADVCLVTSLRDGMNLVCKEYAAARDDESGCLVLSRSAGAARELKAALLIEPRDADDVAAVLHDALSMPLHEQRMRMRSLRAVVRNFNVHRWAARLLAAGQAAVLRARTDHRAVAAVAEAA